MTAILIALWFDTVTQLDSDLLKFPPQNECESWIEYLNACEKNVEVRAFFEQRRPEHSFILPYLDDIRKVRYAWILLNDCHKFRCCYECEYSIENATQALKYLRYEIGDDNYIKGKMPLPCWVSQ